MPRYIFTFILILFFFAGREAFSSTEISNSRVIYHSGKSNATITISNPDDKPYIVHAWVDKYIDSKATDDTFFIDLPVFRVEPHKKNSIRIYQSGNTLSNDKESVFWLNIKSFPSINKNKKNDNLPVIVNNKIKVFYRPDNLPGDPGSAYKKIEFVRKGNEVFVYNPTAFCVSFYEIKINGQVLQHPLMVLPGEELDLGNIPSSVSTISWRSINDYGGASEERSITMN